METTAHRIDISVLGPLAIRVDGNPVELNSRLSRRLLAYLALRSDHLPSSNEIIDVLWHGCWPATAPKSLGNLVLRLRRTVCSPDVPRWHGRGYSIDRDLLVEDRCAFELAAVTSRLHLTAGRAHVALIEADRGLGLWRGEPWDDLDDLDAARLDRERLVQMKQSLEEARAEALVELGEFDHANSLLIAMTDESPYSERRWCLHALALYGAGQRRASTKVLADARSQLALVGLTPGPELRRLAASSRPMIRRWPTRRYPFVTGHR